MLIFLPKIFSIFEISNPPNLSILGVLLKSIIVDLNKQDELLIPETFNGINAEIPPSKFDCDISTNVAMVLAKLNKKSPIELAEQISSVIKEKDLLIETITVVKPGFINIKFKPLFWTNFIEQIITHADTYGVNDKEKKLLSNDLGGNLEK